MAISGLGEDPLSGLSYWNQKIDVDEIELVGADVVRVAIENVAPYVGPVDPDSTYHPRKFIHQSIQEHFIATARSSWPLDVLESFVVSHLHFDRDGEDANALTLAYHPQREAALVNLIAHMELPDPSAYGLDVWDALDPTGEFDRFLCRVAAVSLPNDWPSLSEAFAMARRRRAELGDSEAVNHLIAWTESNSDAAVALLDAIATGKLAPSRTNIRQIIDIDADLLTSSRALTAILSFLTSHRLIEAGHDQVRTLAEAGRSVLAATTDTLSPEALATIAELLLAPVGSHWFEDELAESVRDSSISTTFIDEVLSRSLPKRAVMASHLARTSEQRASVRRHFLARAAETRKTRRQLNQPNWRSTELWRALRLSDPAGEAEIDDAAWRFLQEFEDLECARFLLREGVSSPDYANDAAKYLSRLVRESTDSITLQRALGILASRNRYLRSTRALGESAFWRVAPFMYELSLRQLGMRLIELGCQNVEILEKVCRITQTHSEMFVRREIRWGPHREDAALLSRTYSQERVDTIALDVIDVLWEQISSCVDRFGLPSEMTKSQKLGSASDRRELMPLLVSSVDFLSGLKLSHSAELEFVRIAVESLRWCSGGMVFQIYEAIDGLDSRGALTNADRIRALEFMLDGRDLDTQDWDRVIRLYVSLDPSANVSKRIDPFSVASEALQRYARSRPVPETSYLRDYGIQLYGEAAWRSAQAMNRETEAQEVLTTILRGGSSDLELAILSAVQGARIAARDLADRTIAISGLARRERRSLMEGVRRGSSPEDWIAFYRQVARAR